MKTLLPYSAIVLFIVLAIPACDKKAKEISYHLWYKQPAVEWTDALPVGNGRLGAMVFGNIEKERIQFNEESLWAGVRRNCNNPLSLEYLSEVQQLLLQDKNNEALILAQKYLMGIPPRIRSYQTCGDVFIKMDIDTSNVSGYNRSLNVNTGISSTVFHINGNEITREVFASAPDNCIFIHINSSNERLINGSIHLSRKQDAQVQAAGTSTLVMEGQIIDPADPQRGPGGAHMKFASLLKIIDTDGMVSHENNALSVKNASKVTMALTATTDYNLEKLNFDRSLDPANICRSTMAKISNKPYKEIKHTHIADHRKLFNRVSLKLGNHELDSLPTDQRLFRMKNGKKDDGLLALYFQYGRYLLMGSSRSPGVLPANLQGVWNHHFNAPWNSDYHTNINVQMNYWPSEVCNLSETSIPYIQFFSQVREPGSVTAREMYGADGWTMHHGTNIFGRTAVQDAIRHGMFPMGAAWVCFPVWRHFEYTTDTAYLKTTGWPVIKGAVEFIIDFLIENPEGYLVTAPSYSPENTFYLPEPREEMRLTYAPTMDIMIIREIFKYALSAIEILKADKELQSVIQHKLDSLPPVQKGADGTIQEWIKDYEEVEPGHRHISHLLGLHPGTQITEEDTEIFNAARATIERRLSHGGGHTGWSRAWIINFYARLLDGQAAYEHLNLLLQKSTLTNLFDTHPPFQIDGNFGGTAGIAEMLLQSHAGYIHLLPALPEAWNEGKVSGLKARGAFTINMEWKEGNLVSASVKAGNDGTCKLRYRDQYAEVNCEPGKTYKLKEDFKF